MKSIFSKSRKMQRREKGGNNYRTKLRAWLCSRKKIATLKTEKNLRIENGTINLSVTLEKEEGVKKTSTPRLTPESWATIT